MACSLVFFVFLNGVLGLSVLLYLYPMEYIYMHLYPIEAAEYNFFFFYISRDSEFCSSEFI